MVEKGLRLARSGFEAQAEETYRSALKLDPQSSDAWAHLGCLLMDAHRDLEALDCFRHARADSAPAVEDGASHLDAATARREATSLLAEIVAARPNWAAGQCSLGYAYKGLGEPQRARAHLQTGARLDPALTTAVEALLSNIDLAEGNYAQALAAADRGIQANPRYCYGHIARADCCASLLLTEEACKSRRQALSIQPNLVLHSSLLFELNFLTRTSPEDVYAEARRWNSLWAEPLAPQIQPHTNVPDPERRIKIGYVSPDLYNHAIMRFFPPVVENHDRSRFDAFVYAIGSKSDDMTEQFRRRIDKYVSLPGGALEIPERARADGIDILVDLAGHTMPAALQAFALKPAPVQVSWLGVLATTGLSTMDYYLGDAQLPAEGTDCFFSERIYRLPVLCCYRPWADVPVAPSPCRKRGYLTFGSFNKARKITREVVKLWSAILHLAPGSRLLLKYGGYEIDAMRERFLNWFRDDGIPQERITLAEPSPQLDYLRAFSEIDVALDPFPYNGGSTTLDTLWMGVPVVTLAGRLPVQCAGASFLTAIGMPDLVAKTPEQYLKVALALGRAAQEVSELRLKVRQALQESPLMDEPGFVRTLEEAYRTMWRNWCHGRR